MGSRDFVLVFQIVAAAAAGSAVVGSAAAAADAVHDASCFGQGGQSVAGGRTFAATAACL